MQHKKSVLAAILFLITGFTACDSNEIGDSKDVNQDKVYMDYRISYTEGEENVSISLQYRFAGSAGTTLVLNGASHAELDGEKLKVDSSEASGAFYNADKNFSHFIGNHTIKFTDINGKKFENTFNFSAFNLNALPTTVDAGKDLVISYNSVSLSAADYFEINSIDTDSSFHYQQAGPGSSITIPAKELMRQKENGFSIDCTLYREIPLSQTTPEGGSLKIFYRLKPVKIKLQPLNNL